MNAPAQQFRTDDYFNALTKLAGGLHDKRAGAFFGRRRWLPVEELDALYEQSAVVARICDQPAGDAFREGYTINGDGIDWPKLRNRLEELGVNASFADAIRWSRLHGAALVFMPVDDGRKHDQPLDIINVRRVHPLKVFDVGETRVLDYDSTFASRSYLQPLYYEITTPMGRQVKVHHSRILRFDAMTLPPRRLRHTPRGFGPGVIDRIYDSMSRLGQTRGYAANVIHVLSLIVFRIKGYKAIASAKDGKENSTKLLEAIRAGMDMLGAIGIDTDDAAEVLSLDIRGLTDLLGKFEDALVADNDMPRELVLNETPSGLNVGEISGPVRLWYDKVASFQREKIEPRLDTIVDLVLRADGRTPPQWETEWLPLWQPTESEDAATRKVRAETDQIYFTIGALEEGEIRDARFVAKATQIEVQPQHVEPLALEPQPDDPLEPDEAEAAPQAEAPTVAELAMNGAQISALAEIAKAVQAGELPRDAAIGIVAAAFPTISSPERVLGSAGLTPPPAAAAPTQPAGAPVDTEGDEETDEPVEAAHAPPEGETLRTPAEIGERLGVSAASIKAMHRRREIGGWQIGGRWRFAESEVLAASHRPMLDPDEDPNADPDDEEDGGAADR